MKRSDCLKQSKIFKLRVRLSWARKIFWMLQSSSGRKWKKCEQTLLFIAMHHWGYTSLEVKSSYGYPLVPFRPDKEDSTVLSQDQIQGATELRSNPGGHWATIKPRGSLSYDHWLSKSSTAVITLNYASVYNWGKLLWSICNTCVSHDYHPGKHC